MPAACAFALLASTRAAAFLPAGRGGGSRSRPVNAASLASFGTATVAGIAAQLIAGYRLGRLDEVRGPNARGFALPQPMASGWRRRSACWR